MQKHLETRNVSQYDKCPSPKDTIFKGIEARGQRHSDPKIERDTPGPQNRLPYIKLMHQANNVGPTFRGTRAMVL